MNTNQLTLYEVNVRIEYKCAPTGETPEVQEHGETIHIAMAGEFAFGVADAAMKHPFKDPDGAPVDRIVKIRSIVNQGPVIIEETAQCSVSTSDSSPSSSRSTPAAT